MGGGRVRGSGLASRRFRVFGLGNSDIVHAHACACLSHLHWAGPQSFDLTLSSGQVLFLLAIFSPTSTAPCKAHLLIPVDRLLFPNLCHTSSPARLTRVPRRFSSGILFHQLILPQTYIALALRCRFRSIRPLKFPSQYHAVIPLSHC